MVQRAMSGGRIAIAGGSLSATKSGLTIAIRYAERRRQFGSKQEKLLLDYPLHQRRLLPRLATAYAIDAALADLARASQETSALTDPEFDELTALLKAYASWNAVDTLQTCREACGGQGYLAQNRIGVLRADIDPMTTLEGDNSLLYMFSAKVQLEALRSSTAGKRSAVLLHGARALGERTAVALALRGAPEARLRDAAWLARLFRARERGALWDAARSFASRREAGADYQSPLLELAEARAERIVLEAFSRRLESSPASLRDTLSALRDLYACTAAHRHAAWYLSHHVLTAADVRRIESRVASLCHELRPRALELVDGFGLPDEWLGDLIAQREVNEPVL
jgi:acyl-CoA oxidase